MLVSISNKCGCKIVCLCACWRKGLIELIEVFTFIFFFGWLELCIGINCYFCGVFFLCWVSKISFSEF